MKNLTEVLIYELSALGLSTCHSIDTDFGMKEMFPTTCSVPCFKIVPLCPPPPPSTPKVFKNSSDTPYIKILKHA